MNRSILEEAVRAACEPLGYAFRCCAADYLSQALPAFPAAWLCPPRLLTAEGRRHGRLTYEVVLHLLRDGAKLAPADRNGAWALLEQDMLEVFTALSDAHRVVAVERLSIRPSCGRLSTRGDLAQTAEARVVTWF